MRVISWLAEKRLASQERLCSMKLVRSVTQCSNQATGWINEESRFDSWRWEEELLCSTTSRPALGLTQALIQRGAVASSPGGKRAIICSLPISSTYRKDCGPGSVVSIATSYGLDGQGIKSRWGRDYPQLSSLLHNGYRVFPGGKKRPGLDADPSPFSSAVVKKK